MNQHLNIFNPYTKTNRETNQLENDLTRALAITLLENNLFLYQFIKHITNNKEGVFEQIINTANTFKNIEISIQKKISAIENEFEHLFAVGISGVAIKTGDSFFDSQNKHIYDPITDMFISIGNTAIIFEIKPNNTDCSDQLYNQAFNLCKTELNKSMVTPVSYTWQEVTKNVIEINSFQEISNSQERFISDFINYIRNHNYSWLPESPLQHLSFEEANYPRIQDRLRTIITQSSLEELNKPDRIGFLCTKSWADEILIWINPNEKSIKFGVFPANTKGQGYHVFKDDGVPKFKKEITINGITRPLNNFYHIKLSSFQRYFAGLDFTDNELNDQLYTKHNFLTYSGRNKKEKGDWEKLADLFDKSFTPSFDWKTKAEWENKVINSGKTQFDISFGYGVSLNIKYSEFKELDNDNTDIKKATDFIKNIALELEDIFH